MCQRQLQRAQVWTALPVPAGQRAGAGYSSGLFLPFTAKGSSIQLLSALQQLPLWTACFAEWRGEELRGEPYLPGLPPLDYTG